MPVLVKVAAWLKVSGAFTKLGTATISFVAFVWPSARNSASTGRFFMKIDIGIFLKNLSRKFKFN